MPVFDVAAKTYDEDFTNSNIGKYLRQSVWGYLDKVLNNNQKLDILELNCGTGADAVFFGSLGHNVIATDISEEMLAITKDRIIDNKIQDKVKIRQLDVTSLLASDFDKKFDLVFSNFGGLNCLNEKELRTLCEELEKLIKPDGRFISVIMPRVCLWESFYFLSKFQFDKVFRRNRSSHLEVNLGGEIVLTWYFSPGEYMRIFNNNFRKIRFKPVGVFLPPSYTEPFFKNRLSTLNLLNSMESLVSQVPVLSYVSDHFLCDLQIRRR